MPHKDALEFLHCDDCDQTEQPNRTHPVTAPSKHSFNYELIIDVLECKDYDLVRYSFLSIVCDGTTLHAAPVMQDEGSGSGYE